MIAKAGRAKIRTSGHAFAFGEGGSRPFMNRLANEQRKSEMRPMTLVAQEKPI